jgi:hypothetical protein
MTNFRDLFRQVRAELDEVAPEDVKRRLDEGESFGLLDVREQDEVS